jgi:hypothetical protein
MTGCLRILATSLACFTPQIFGCGTLGLSPSMSPVKMRVQAVSAPPTATGRCLRYELCGRDGHEIATAESSGIGGRIHHLESAMERRLVAWLDSTGKGRWRADRKDQRR